MTSEIMISACLVMCWVMGMLAGFMIGRYNPDNKPLSRTESAKNYFLRLAKYLEDKK